MTPPQREQHSVLPRVRYRLRFADGGDMVLGRRTVVMGVLNVTPDSFSDGGRFHDTGPAVDHALQMVDDGAGLIDIGGESSRPGADPVAVTDEIDRVVPVIEALRRRSDARISIDTVKPEVARRAIDAGADLLNDIGGLADPAMLDLVRRTGVPAVLMHMRGSPQTMQRDTTYHDVVDEIVEFLGERVRRAAEAGLGDDKIAVDPGIGFGKSSEGNLTILRRLGEVAALGRAVLVGASRKAFIGAVLNTAVDDRLEGSLAVAAFSAAAGAHLIRAHDVRSTARVVAMIDAIRDSADEKRC